MAEPKVAVVIPNWNGRSWLGPCLDALGRQDLTHFHTIIVDNGSSDDSVAFVRARYPSIEVIELGHNTGFANAANIGIARAASSYIALLNADTQVFPDWLGQLTGRMERARPEIGAINSQVLRMDRPGLIDNAGDELSWYGAATKHGYGRAAVELSHEREVFSPCAAACLYRRSFLVETGGFDADFFAYLEDVDLGLRGRLLGFKYLYLPTAKVLHKGHGAALAHRRYVEMMTRNRLLLFAKNIPGKLLLRHAAQLLHGQLYFIITYARPWSSLKGYLSFIICLPGAFSKRRQIFRNTSLNPDQIEALLHNGAPCPSASGMIRRFLSKTHAGRYLFRSARQ